MQAVHGIYVALRHHAASCLTVQVLPANGK
jgi:hypothetical protein